MAAFNEDGWTLKKRTSINKYDEGDDDGGGNNNIVNFLFKRGLSACNKDTWTFYDKM